MISANNYTGHWMANAAGAAMRSQAYQLATEPMEPEPATTTMGAIVVARVTEWAVKAGTAGLEVRNRLATVVGSTTEAVPNGSRVENDQWLAQLANLTVSVTQVAHKLTDHLDVADPMLWVKLVLAILGVLNLLNNVVRIMWYRRTGHIRRLPGKILIYPLDVSMVKFWDWILGYFKCKVFIKEGLLESFFC